MSSLPTLPVTRRRLLGAIAASLAANPLASLAQPTLAERFHSAQVPRPGDIWRYRYVSGWRNQPSREYRVTVTESTAERVVDRLNVDDVASAEDTRAFTNVFAVTERVFPGFVVREVAPYIQAFRPGILGTDLGRLVVPRPNWGFPWTTWVKMYGPEPVSVPAGTFDAVRVEIYGDRYPLQLDNMIDPQRFWETVWYAPAIKRSVRHTRSSVSSRGNPLDRDLYELLEFRPAA